MRADEGRACISKHAPAVHGVLFGSWWLYICNAGLYIVTAGTDGLVAVWADEGKACIAKRTCATPVAAACWHPSDNALALQVRAFRNGLIRSDHPPSTVD